MNYEKFNDAMCRLRQAEEDFNKKLGEIFKPFADKMNKQQKEDNDDYYKGLKDMHEAIQLIATDGSDGGMSIFELKDAFGTASVCDIILGYSPMEIMGKTLAWTTKRKESQEFHVGDEVKTDNVIGIVTSYDENQVWITYRPTYNTCGFDYCWAYKSKCKKTGKHFDNIPFDYNPEKSD